MENSKYILGLLESVLGKSKPDKNGSDHSFSCPFCNHKKPKLVVNTVTGKYNCWTCFPATKGKNPVTLLKKLGADPSIVSEMAGYFKGNVGDLVKYAESLVALPKEFKPLNKPNSSLEYKHAMAYLKSRNIDSYDIKKYNIGYCEYGRYAKKIIIPSYDHKGKLNYFVARSYDKSAFRKFDAPSCSKSELIGFENLINWSIPIILCEGPFDAIAIKRNCIPLFGKTIPKSLLIKLSDPKIKKVYLALDNDALSEALQYSEKLISSGKEVYLLELEGKDPSEIGFKGMLNILHSAKKLTQGELLMKRMITSLKKV